MAKPPRRRVAAVAQVLVSAVAAANDDSIVTLALGVNSHSRLLDDIDYVCTTYLFIVTN